MTARRNYFGRGGETNDPKSKCSDHTGAADSVRGSFQCQSGSPCCLGIDRDTGCNHRRLWTTCLQQELQGSDCYLRLRLRFQARSRCLLQALAGEGGVARWFPSFPSERERSHHLWNFARIAMLIHAEQELLPSGIFATERIFQRSLAGYSCGHISRAYVHGVNELELDETSEPVIRTACSLLAFYFQGASSRMRIRTHC
jgi:hypothetical protein